MLWRCCLYNKIIYYNLLLLLHRDAYIMGYSNQFSLIDINSNFSDPLDEYRFAINDALFKSWREGMPEENREYSARITPRNVDIMAQFPSGAVLSIKAKVQYQFVLRADLFENKSMVHLPPYQWMHKGHCYLNLTKDYMQTAVNAFAIFLQGNVDDILRLPSLYVLRSARAISMMSLAREKLAATWTVVKGDDDSKDIPIHTLEMFRPLFKYIDGREIARLNLRDDRILSYIGTHAELNRHQVGVVSSTYIRLNDKWQQPRYLNLMNNLLCGVPMTFMRKVPESTYLQLSHQVFYHIRACDPLQRRFFLTMMTRTQVLGKSNSWSARDVARLGLLLTELDGPELNAISPKAMTGLTAQVMMEMSAPNLMYITEVQMSYLEKKSLSILIKKLNKYNDDLKILYSRGHSLKYNLITFLLFLQIISYYLAPTISI